MPLSNEEIKKILVISLTNIGDVILTFPVIDILKEKFPYAQISVVVGPKAESILKNNPHLKNIYIFNKRQPTMKTIEWVFDLRQEHFDMVVDLRNTAIPFFIGAKYRTPYRKVKNGQVHMKEKHLLCLKSVCAFDRLSSKQCALHISNNDKNLVDQLLSQVANQKFVVIAPGAANDDKKWTHQGFAQVADSLIETTHQPVVFVGDKKDETDAAQILAKMKNPAINLCGQTNLIELAEIMRRSSLVISNDSAPMHLASYLNLPVLAIFGPSDPLKYGPWSSKSQYVKSSVFCTRCQNSKSQEKHICMSSIKFDDVLPHLSLGKTIFKQ